MPSIRYLYRFIDNFCPIICRILHIYSLYNGETMKKRMEVGTMERFKKHDFEYFSSKEELEDWLTRRKASIMFEAIKDMSMDEVLRATLKLFLIEAVGLGINPTLLVKNSLDLLLDDTGMFFDLIRNGEAEGYNMEEVFEMWKEESKDLKGMTEQEIYNVFSHE